MQESVNADKFGNTILKGRREPMEKRELPDIYEPKDPPMSEKKKQSILEKLWLTYYNDTLLQKGVITKDEHDRMRVKIRTRAGPVER